VGCRFNFEGTRSIMLLEQPHESVTRKSGDLTVVDYENVTIRTCAMDNPLPVDKLGFYLGQGVSEMS
jgi:hypothetical protein